MHVDQSVGRAGDSGHDEQGRAELERQVRHLQERLAFYEGFDALIQENVTHARELLRLAAQEREKAAADADQARLAAEQRDKALHAELGAIVTELSGLAQATGGLARRIGRILEEPGDDVAASRAQVAGQPIAVVIHGVPSAQTARSLQRFVSTLPAVSNVAAREYVGGVLRLDVRASEPLRAEQVGAWPDMSGVRILTERPDVVELALEGSHAGEPATG